MDRIARVISNDPGRFTRHIVLDDLVQVLVVPPRKQEIVEPATLVVNPVRRL